MIKRTIALLAFAIAIPLVAQSAMDSYSRTVVFDNATSQQSYFYSRVKDVAPSSVAAISNHLPLEHEQFVSGPNALTLRWKSERGGAWSAELQPAQWPNRGGQFEGSTLSFWIYAPSEVPSAALPQLSIRDSAGGFSAPIKLSNVAQKLPVRKWTQVAIPFASFRSVSVRPFDPHRLNALVFTQSEEDAVEHTLFLDEIRTETPNALDLRAPAAPRALHAKAYERHVDLTWQESKQPAVADLVIYRSLNGGGFKQVGTQRPGVQRFMDFIGDDHAHARYRITARTSRLKESLPSQTVDAETHPMTGDELLSMVEEASFHYYWDGAEPHSGMALESVPGGEKTVAVGGSGFGIMAMIVAADRGFVPRDEVVARLLRITGFLEQADRFHGVWPHFLNGRTGKMMPVFGIYDDGADLVETSFLMQGLLAARGYFTRDDAAEKELRARITRMWQQVEWDWFLTPSKDALWWHWSPHYGYMIANRLQGYNESMITYVLAIASPTHSVPAPLYKTGWSAQGDSQHPFPIPNDYYGIHVDVNYTPQSPGPMFFTHYNFFGWNPHYRDAYTDWFQNSRNIALVQYKYAIANPQHEKGYGADAWGLSAVTGPRGYREFKPFTEDDGTLAPTAALGSYAYTPAESLAALKHFYRDLGANTWTIYGFRNAFNQQMDWYAPDELALNQGPQAIMIENGRTGLLWRSFMANPEMKTAQKKMGLKPYGPSAVQPHTPKETQ